MMQTKKAGRGSDQFPLRLPDGMRDAIKAAAEISGRSMNVEIVSRLEASFSNAELEDAERRDYERRIRVLLDNEARMKDYFKDALNALTRGDAEKAQQILAPLAWYERPAADDNSNELG
ncbi:Arc family DNA-binding protein [Shinella sp.]|uniref:Arc family DNA-binding protein n=1 Tax=Shinella sp. TaxID=1870904 RepID=UPI00289D1044|nr:Arc family DNA-binding protein [Shinella sp.]